MDPYSTARTIAATLIATRDGQLTTEIIRECVEQASTLSAISPEAREALARELESTHQTVIGEERDLVGDDKDWEIWLPKRKGQLQWRYWSRYDEYLKRGPMNPDVRRRQDASTDRVLGYLGDPERPGSWDRRGLVVGLVQSGKTSHYLGLINKAVDSGYKVIVVLTGFTESLRVQTQIRAEEGFLGYYLEPGTKRGELRSRAIGVGEIAPGQKPDSVTTRTNDFKKAIAANFGIQVGGKEILFVIKKNVGVLRNLLSWIESCGNAIDSAGQKFVKDVPLLVIDDESDVGSVDTKKGNIVNDDPDQDHEPSRINEQIRKLLSLFSQSSYVGYTATPFANVLIHDGGFTEKLGEDLFPRSFIVSLPTPSDHVGPSMVFGGASEEESGIPIIRHIPKTESAGDNAWVPPVHKKLHVPLFEGRNEAPPSLRKAILSFVLVCAARRIRSVGTKHNSMLIHVTRFNDVQERVEDQVGQELAGVVERLRTGVALDPLLSELKGLWLTDFLPTTREIARHEGGIFKNVEHGWAAIQAELLAVASAIQIRTINGLAGEVLDYEDHKEDGLSVIAIGGDKLSRGLTLDGLSVSYFLRCSRMYDTLMQMGRWFGYRPGYLDLCRLYTTCELSEWFGHIATATEELRGEFDLMSNSGGTPKDFGLKVLSHPQLMVTSRIKMRHGKTIPITFDGDIVETINFDRRAETQEANWNALEDLVRSLGSGAKRASPPPRANTVQWSQVSASDVISFLRRYEGHSAAVKVRPRLLAEYVEAELSAGRLVDWTVLISGGSKGKRTLAETDFTLVERAWHLTGSDPDQTLERKELMDSNHYRIRRLVNPPDELVDLTESAQQMALDATSLEWERDSKGRDRPTQAAGRFVRRQRNSRQGLLVIYPLDPGDDKGKDETTPIVAFAISFPAVPGGGASKVSYMVNNVYQQLELDYQ